MSKKSATSTEAIMIHGIKDTDVYYQTGFDCPGPVVYLQKGTSKWLVVSDMEYNRACREASVNEVFTPGMLMPATKERRDSACWAPALAGKVKVKKLRVPGRFPLATARMLEKNGFSPVVMKPPLFPRRAVKNDREIKYLAKAQLVAARAMRMAMQRISEAAVDRRGRLYDQEGLLTASSLKKAIRVFALQHGARADETIVACGADTADPHASGGGPLRAGRFIVIDIFPCLLKERYWGDITRTVIKGRADERQTNTYKAVLAAQKAALAEIKPGVPGSVVHARADEELRRQGFVTAGKSSPPVGFIHATGHGVGLDIHESPRLAAGSREKLRAGNVVTVEPGWYVPSFGGVRIEDTVVVTPNGYRVLASCGYRFVL